MLKKFILAIFAGIAISIGGTIFLLSADRVIGASLFAVGILMVMEFKLALFTGYVPTARGQDNWKTYFINCGIIFIGNTLGTIITALLLRLTRLKDTLLPVCQQIVDVKVNDNLLSVLILGVFCGIIIGAIVKATNYKKQVLYVLMMIAVFILSSFEHVVANSYYVSLTFDIFTLKGIIFVLVNMVGNFIGGFGFSYVENIAKNKENIE